MCDDLLAESEIWLNETLLVADLDRNAKLQEGRNPAQGLRSAAIDLSCSKQTVFSPNIERLVAMAAKVALVSFEPGSPSLKSYERALRINLALDGVRASVNEYDRFKKRYRSNGIQRLKREYMQRARASGGSQTADRWIVAQAREIVTHYVNTQQ